MNKTKQTRRIESEMVRTIFTKIADAICNAAPSVTLALSGNTFEIHLDGGSVNITVNEEGGTL